MHGDYCVNGVPQTHGLAPAKAFSATAQITVALFQIFFLLCSDFASKNANFKDSCARICCDL
jgi:hypothetical protein